MLIVKVLSVLAKACASSVILVFFPQGLTFVISADGFGTVQLQARAYVAVRMLPTVCMLTVHVLCTLLADYTVHHSSSLEA